jgi:hypothetical protein
MSEFFGGLALAPLNFWMALGVAVVALLIVALLLLQRRGVAALAWAIGGLVAAAFIVLVDSSGHTLHEVIVEGPPRDAAAGSLVPFRKSAFEVEHAGVKHQIQVWPDGGEPKVSYSVLRKRSVSENALKGQSIPLYVEIRDPDGKSLLKEQPVSRDGQEVTLTFTPERVGTHTAVVQALSRNARHLHVLIADPKKKNGKRLPGY